MAFTPGVLAFTRVITVDVTGIQIGSSAVASELGQILDSDVYFTPAIQTLRLLPLKPIGGSYTVYAEALSGAANPSQFNNALTSICRNAMTDAAWPPLQACIVPSVNISFTTRTRPGP